MPPLGTRLWPIFLANITRGAVDVTLLIFASTIRGPLPSGPMISWNRSEPGSTTCSLRNPQVVAAQEWLVISISQGRLTTSQECGVDPIQAALGHHRVGCTSASSPGAEDLKG